jgi:hypothetical protein
MRNYLRRVARFFGLIATVPLVVGFIGSWSAGFGFLLFVLAIPAAILILAIGSVVWIIRSFQLGKNFDEPRSRIAIYGIAPLLIVTTVCLAWPSLALGSYTGSLARLMVNRGHYEAIIAKARMERKSSWYEDDDGVTYSVDLGPPLRVAFNPAGMLDNWSGIIYDPTGDLMLADGFDPKTGKFVAPDRVTKVFGGDLVSCRHLWGSYYDCSFT